MQEPFVDTSVMLVTVRYIRIAVSDNLSLVILNSFFFLKIRTSIVKISLCSSS